MSSVDLSQAVDLGALMAKSQEEKAKQLPKPQGYRILCAIPEAEEAFESGIIKSDETRRHDELLTTEFRIINDDSVEAVVDDPRGIKRKFI